MKATLITITAIFVLTACKNDCQDICTEMAAYAEECGFTVSDEEVDACLAEQKEANDVNLDVCDEMGGAETIRDEWPCDEMALYWDGTATTTGS